MRFPAKCCAFLLPLLLTACLHKTQQALVQPLAPPIPDNPPPPPSNAPDNLPPPVESVPAEPAATVPTPAQPLPKPIVKHKKPAAKNTTEEAANPNPGVSAIGQLSSGNPADYRRETEDLISATDRGLLGITRPLNDTEQKTADHIREFLKEAKTALTSGDVDGAHTLAAKAKVLLAELTQ